MDQHKGLEDAQVPSGVLGGRDDRRHVACDESMGEHQRVENDACDGNGQREAARREVEDVRGVEGQEDEGQDGSVGGENEEGVAEVRERKRGVETEERSERRQFAVDRLKHRCFCQDQRGGAEGESGDEGEGGLRELDVEDGEEVRGGKAGSFEEQPKAGRDRRQKIRRRRSRRLRKKSGNAVGEDEECSSGDEGVVAQEEGMEGGP